MVLGLGDQVGRPVRRRIAPRGRGAAGRPARHGGIPTGADPALDGGRTVRRAAARPFGDDSHGASAIRENRRGFYVSQIDSFSYLRLSRGIGTPNARPPWNPFARLRWRQFLLCGCGKYRCFLLGAEREAQEEGVPGGLPSEKAGEAKVGNNWAPSFTREGLFFSGGVRGVPPGDRCPRRPC
jgi:hypothetical protein